ncbi:Putative F0F1-ATP synthase subunit Ca2+/Mg2+ transporter [Candidatus Trichorickettsia mobilis]|uniref:F0F1-ATP synthase subunit Ca2+/Mg2+ transporter n=1 Tax=Candidatus Trichorickettsia mobilis TaxID=1346319 RepID=A0ABZ0UQJ8_9RICK|nr:AtpZ/AtpI family protein [Candidatus Trichorickettsia mobilis]WPY00318.1 Putative F0F1-ATP synthase subunit Ca2+/Mg2+ transporter [Candidatus Trichorickettsia mobilis]
MDDNELNNIFARIKKFKHNKSSTNTPDTKSINPWIIAIELVSGAIVGIIIGHFFDKIFDSKPLLLIICLLLGLVASFKTIWQKINDRNHS